GGEGGTGRLEGIGGVEGVGRRGGRVLGQVLVDGAKGSGQLVHRRVAVRIGAGRGAGGEEGPPFFRSDGWAASEAAGEVAGDAEVTEQPAGGFGSRHWLERAVAIVQAGEQLVVLLEQE